MQNSINFRAIHAHALPYLPAIVRRILPDGRLQGHEYVARNPNRADRHLGSFKVNLRTAHWADFATGDAGGDIISLCAYLQGLSQHKAALYLVEKLGLGGRAAL